MVVAKSCADARANKSEKQGRVARISKNSAVSAESPNGVETQENEVPKGSLKRMG